MDLTALLCGALSGAAAGALLWRWGLASALAVLAALVVGLATAERWSVVGRAGVLPVVVVAGLVVVAARWRALPWERGPEPGPWPGPVREGLTLVALLVALATFAAHPSARDALLLVVAVALGVCLRATRRAAPLAGATALTALLTFPVAVLDPVWVLPGLVLAGLSLLRVDWRHLAAEPGAGRPVALAGPEGLAAVAAGRRDDEVDERALASYAAGHGRPSLAPVAVVIAAYREAEGLPRVLAAMPAEVCGLPLDVVVVDDGSGDATPDVAEASGRAHVVRCDRNRGQGAALRLGYRFARDHGAAYVVTTDADGQYDVDDLPAVLAPVVAGDADFVSGSRVLGALENRDRVRWLGTHVFAWLVTLLTGTRVTDTSFGLRAMRAEVTAAVTLTQPQYQSSELLIGVLAHGFRVREVAATMHPRGAGSTKKGGNLVYGRRYAGVVLGTWWRERRRRPAAVPALPGWRPDEHAASTG